MEQQSGGILAVVDIDNALSSVEGFTAERCPSRLLNEIRRLGPVVYAFAFADFRTHAPVLDRALMLNGFVPVQCPKTTILATGEKKDSVDPMLTAYVNTTLTATPGISTIVLISGDRDFAPMLAAWKMRGKRIVVMTRNGLSSELREVADQVVRLESAVPEPAVPIGPRPRPAVRAFAGLLHSAGGPDDFRQANGADLCAVRDALAVYVRSVLVRYMETGRRGFLTATFLRRGLATQIGRARFTDTDIEHLVTAMCGTMLLTERNAGRILCYPLNDAHPFVQYATGTVAAA